MKKLIATLFIFITTITFALSQHVVIKITPKTTKTDLDNMVASAKKSKVYITITNAQYKHGKLRKITGSVHANSPTGSPSGTFTSNHLKHYTIMVDNGNELSIQGK